MCGSGKSCWCRLVVTEKYKGTMSEDDILIGSGQLSQEEAEYFVKLHNENLERIK